MATAHNPQQVAQLKAELERARENVILLEKQLAAFHGASGAARQERKPLAAAIEFIGEFDVVDASGIDLSDGGICFQIAAPLSFEMRFQCDGVQYQRKARLIWARDLRDGSRLGFQFTEGGGSDF